MSAPSFTMLPSNADNHLEWHALLATACEQHANHGLIAADETILAETLHQQDQSIPCWGSMAIAHCSLLWLTPSGAVKLIRGAMQRWASTALDDASIGCH